MVVKYMPRFFTTMFIIYYLSVLLVLYDIINTSNNYITITPVMTNITVVSGEVFSLNLVSIDKEKIVLKEDVIKYITTENYKEFLDNQNYFKHNIKNGTDLLLKDIIEVDR